MPTIPNHVANYSIFKEGRRLLGLADVSVICNLQNLTATLKGSGIPGEIDMPVQCHFQAMAVTLNWHTVTEDGVYTFWQDGAVLDCWAAHQYHDTEQNRIVHHGWRYVLGTVPKGYNLGKLEVGTTGDASTELELITIRVLFNGTEKLMIDKGNFQCRIDGRDFGGRIRQLIGLDS